MTEPLLLGCRRVRLLPEGVKRPQMQWNVLNVRDDSPMFAGLESPLWMYFVHSYAPATTENVVATCDYGGDIVAAVQRDNLWATQFHPEKSGATGLKVLANFVAAVSSWSRLSGSGSGSGQAVSGQAGSGSGSPGPGVSGFA